jgi:hypothetical protein
MRDHLDRADDEVLAIATVEHIDALRTIDEVVSTPGLDLAFIGPGDLATGMGHRGRAEHPEVQAALLRFEAAIRPSPVVLGGAAPTAPGRSSATEPSTRASGWPSARASSPVGRTGSPVGRTGHRAQWRRGPRRGSPPRARSGWARAMVDRGEAPDGEAAVDPNRSPAVGCALKAQGSASRQGHHPDQRGE